MEVKDETETVADVDQTMMKEDTIEVGFFLVLTHFMTL